MNARAAVRQSLKMRVLLEIAIASATILFSGNGYSSLLCLVRRSSSKRSCREEFTVDVRDHRRKIGCDRAVPRLCQGCAVLRQRTPSGRGVN
ncbi:hypothetical protein MTO96_029875 [Rhipicephalus appendiculatus]